MAQLMIPHSVEAEQGVIGCCLLEPVALIQVLDRLTADMFYSERHRMIWEAIFALAEKAVPPDLIAVTDELRKKNKLEAVGGAAYLTELPSKVGSLAHIEHYANIVRDKYIRRQLIQAAREVAVLAQDEEGDISEQAGEAERLVFSATQMEAEGKFAAIDAVAKNFWDYAYTRRNEGASGISTGFNLIDIATGGLHAGDVVVLAARPGEGKTTLSLQIGYSVAEKLNKPVAFFSLEMGKEQIANKLIVGLGGFNNQAIRNRRLSKEEWQAGYEIVKNMSGNLMVDDQAGVTTMQMRSRARRLKAEKGDLGLVVIDFLQLITDRPPLKNSSRNEQVGLITRRCKEMAKELGVPLLLLSQLNRSIEMRANKMPTLSDLRESGEIEQVADVVMFIHQPKDAGDNRELIIAKQRMLPAGTVRGLTFNNAWFMEDELAGMGVPASWAASRQADRLFGGAGA
jgi:replicative DNA helicase